VASSCGITSSEQLPLSLNGNDGFTTSEISFSAAVDLLYSDAISYFRINPDGTVDTSDNSATCENGTILSGSFNPLHEGHIGMMNTAEEFLNSRNESNLYRSFELSVYNADKPKLDKMILLQRIAQFAGRFSILVTNRVPTFIDKARLFPKSTFVVGYDTAERMLKKQYYNNSDLELYNAFMEKKKLGIRFLVTGRLLNEKYLSVKDLMIPPEFQSIFLPLDFRMDVSSTQLRLIGRKGARG